ncbi:MAG TPA: PilZ domain-containing protein [Nitrospirales bacterium]|nr:PilZ domain-containing protein [Nitrospirales bacterium]
MRLPVISTTAHKGKVLEVDYERETVTLRGPQGEMLGTISWADLIEHIQGTHEADPMANTRDHPRLSLLLKVRYHTQGAKPIDSRAGGIGGGGMFIESTAPLPIGTELNMSFSLPDKPQEWLEAKGTVAWVCPKPDQYTFSTGMGVQFNEISPAVRKRVVDFVNSLKRPQAK